MGVSHKLRAINIGPGPADINDMKIEAARLNRTSLQESQQSAGVSRQRFTKSETLGATETVSLPALEVGQEINATIVAELDDGRILLNIGGALIEANNPGDLIPGDNLRLRVDFLEPKADFVPGKTRVIHYFAGRHDTAVYPGETQELCCRFPGQ